MENQRNQKGISLVELLVVVVIMSIVAAAAFGMMTMTMREQVKLQNKCDSIEAARKSLERMGRIVRMGKTIMFGSNATTLIVQVPKFDDNGFPYNNAFETHTYTVTPDPDLTRPGEFILRWSKDAGAVVPASADPAKGMLNTSIPAPGQVLLSGIVGPANGQVFRYVNKFSPATPVAAVPDALTAPDFTGATIDIELFEHRNSAGANGNYVQPRSFSYKTEVFLRNNSGIHNNTDLSTNS